MLNNIFEIAVIVAAVVYVAGEIFDFYRFWATSRQLNDPLFPSFKKKRATNDKEREYLDTPL